MKITKVNLVYFSPTQTTQRILKSIASVFDVEVVDYDYTLKINKESPPAFGKDELVIIGAPVYVGRVPVVAESFYKSIKGSGTPVIPVVVYGNRDFDDALLELCDYCQDSNFKVICAGAFIGEHSYGEEIAGGRPDTKDLEIAKNLGKQAKKKLEAVKNSSELPKISVSGNRPYRERVPAADSWCPETTGECINCGICVATCPMGIISPDDPGINTNPALCIHCCSCVKKCPVNAKVCTAEEYIKFKTFLIEHCGSIYKEPSLFT